MARRPGGAPARARDPGAARGRYGVGGSDGEGHGTHGAPHGRPRQAAAKGARHRARPRCSRRAEGHLAPGLRAHEPAPRSRRAACARGASRASRRARLRGGGRGRKLRTVQRARRHRRHLSAQCASAASPGVLRRRDRLFARVRPGDAPLRAQRARSRRAARRAVGGGGRGRDLPRLSGGRGRRSLRRAPAHARERTEARQGESRAQGEALLVGGARRGRRGERDVFRRPHAAEDPRCGA